MSWGLLNKEPVTSLSGLSRIKKPAPDIRMTLFNGGEIFLSEYLGKPVVVNFWASWCSACRDEAIVLERMWRIYENEGVVFIGVDVQDIEEKARVFLKEFGVTYPNGMDLDGKITVDYGVVGLPVTFFVNRKGIVEKRWVGAIGDQQIAIWLDEMLFGIDPGSASEGQNPNAYFKIDQVGVKE